MIGPTGAVRVMVATRPVDFRKGTEGLAALVREEMKADPFSGAVYVFRAKRADRVKLIFWDGTRFNKRQTLELMKDFTLVGEISIEPTYAVRLITPDVATLLYRVTYTSSVKGGPPQTVMVLSSSLYVRRDGKWWSVLYQESSIK